MTLEEKNNLAEQVSRLYANIENDLLMNIASKFERGKDLIKEVDEKSVAYDPDNLVLYNDWELQMLKDLGGLNAESAYIISQYSGVTIEEVLKVFEEASKLGLKADDEIISKGIKAGVLKSVDGATQKIALDNILNTASYGTLTTLNKVNNTLLLKVGEQYRKMVSYISSQMIAGTKSYTKALEEAIRKLNAEGITGFVDSAGKNWSPEAYVNMVLKSDMQNTINAMQDERARQHGANYYEISSYSGARPLCSEDQGGIFSVNGSTSDIEDLNGKILHVRRWEDSTYGKPAGILGINCGHSRYLFVPGLSVYNQKRVNKEENDEQYRLNQQQRAYERAIRNTKREIALMEQTGVDTSKAVSKLKSQQERIRTFVSENNLVRKPNREKVYT